MLKLPHRHDIIGEWGATIALYYHEHVHDEPHVHIEYVQIEDYLLGREAEVPRVKPRSNDAH